MGDRRTPKATNKATNNGSAAATTSGVASICVYCGSGAGTNPAYEAAAKTLGKAMAGAGIRLVYGGGGLGLMGAVAHSVIEHGGQVTGIIPSFLSDREHMLKSADELIITDDMHTRKRLMFEKSDAFVALPGGIGTLEELVEQLTWAQLGRHTKPIVVANIANFWAPLARLFEHMRDQAFIRPGLDVRYQIVDAAEDIVPAILRAASVAPPSPDQDRSVTRKF